MTFDPFARVLPELSKGDVWKLLLTCLFAALFCNLVSPHAFAATPPNVILILADDMAIGDLSCFNGGITRTPNLDRLIQGGLWFDHAYSGSPVCAPSRASLLTGRYPHRTGVVSLDMNTEPELTRLHRNETTLPQLFASHGWRTGLVGKWHVGIGSGFGPIARGFQEFDGFHGSDKTAYYKYAIQSDDKMAHVAQTHDQYLTDALSERAVAFVRRHAHQPFFLHLAHYAPHRPLQAPEENIRTYREKGFDEETATVYAMVEIMDRGIGELVAELESLNIRKKTLILFASDNGPDMLVPHRFNCDLRGSKYTVYEGGIRVPFVMNWPGTITPGKRREMIHFTDVLPTLMEICDIKQTSTLPIDGKSFAPLLQSAGTFQSPTRFWQWNRHWPNYTHNAAMNDGEWKLVKPFVTKNKITGDSEAPLALYHLSEDPQESQDISASQPGRVRIMQQELEAWMQEVEADRTRNRTE